MPLFPLAPPKAYSKLGFIDETGQLIIDQIYSDIAASTFGSAGYCIVQLATGGAQVVIDQTGQTVLTLPKHHTAMTPPDAFGIFPVQHKLDADNPANFKVEGHDLEYKGRTAHYGMTLSGEVAFTGEIGSGQNGFYPLIHRPEPNRHLCGVISHTGEITVAPQYDHMHFSQTDPCISVLRDGKIGVIDYHGREIIPVIHRARHFLDLGYVENGVFVCPDTQAGFYMTITLQGEKLASIPASYMSDTYPKTCPLLSEGLLKISGAPSKKGGASLAKSIFLDVYGRPAITAPDGGPLIFAPDMSVGHFSCGLADVRQNGKTGFIDTTGKLAIAPAFYSALPFDNGLAKVQLTEIGYQNGEYAYINKAGAIVATNH